MVSFFGSITTGSTLGVGVTATVSFLIGSATTGGVTMVSFFGSTTIGSTLGAGVTATVSFLIGSATTGGVTIVSFLGSTITGSTLGVGVTTTVSFLIVSATTGGVTIVSFFGSTITCSTCLVVESILVGEEEVLSALATSCVKTAAAFFPFLSFLADFFATNAGMATGSMAGATAPTFVSFL